MEFNGVTKNWKQEFLISFGKKVALPYDSMECLLRRLHRLEKHIAVHLKQGCMEEIGEAALQPAKESLMANYLLRNTEIAIRASVGACLSEVIRITAPNAPFDADGMKAFFMIANAAYETFPSLSGLAYPHALSILQNVSDTQCCVFMLDENFDTLIIEMFHLFLNGISAKHPKSAFANMEKIMTIMINEGDDNDELSLELAKILLTHLKKEKYVVSQPAFTMAKKVFENCTQFLKYYLPEAVKHMGCPITQFDEVVSSLWHVMSQQENVYKKETGKDGMSSENVNQTTDDGIPEPVVSGPSSDLRYKIKYSRATYKMRRIIRKIPTKIDRAHVSSSTGSTRVDDEAPEKDILIKTVASESRPKSLRKKNKKKKPQHGNRQQSSGSSNNIEKV